MLAADPRVAAQHAAACIGARLHVSGGALGGGKMVRTDNGQQLAPAMLTQHTALRARQVEEKHTVVVLDTAAGACRPARFAHAPVVAAHALRLPLPDRRRVDVVRHERDGVDFRQVRSSVACCTVHRERRTLPLRRSRLTRCRAANAAGTRLQPSGRASSCTAACAAVRLLASLRRAPCTAALTRGAPGSLLDDLLVAEDARADEEMVGDVVEPLASMADFNTSAWKARAYSASACGLRAGTPSCASPCPDAVLSRRRG